MSSVSRVAIENEETKTQHYKLDGKGTEVQPRGKEWEESSCSKKGESKWKESIYRSLEMGPHR